MSIIFYSLVLLLLCSSFHACNARSFPAHDQFEYSTNKKNEKLKQVDKNSSVEPINASGAEKEVIKVEEKKAKNIESYNETKLKGDSVVPSVSWKVPHYKQRGEPEVPGFNLDYLPPRTHPPVHN